MQQQGQLKYYKVSIRFLCLSAKEPTGRVMILDLLFLMRMLRLSHEFLSIKYTVQPVKPSSM